MIKHSHATLLLGLALTIALIVGCIQQFQQSPLDNRVLAAETSTTNSALASLKPDHLMIRVPNFESTMQWYKEKFGFTEALRWKEPTLPGVDLAYLELNGFRLEILGGGAPRKVIPTPANVPAHTQFQGYRHLCFRTNDVDATLAELNRRGVPTFAAPYDYPPIQRRLGFVLDNSGNVIEFSGPMKGNASPS